MAFRGIFALMKLVKKNGYVASRMEITHPETYRSFSLDMNKVSEWDEKEIDELLAGKREVEMLSHMSRVVGYYSTTDNWNASKIGELKDRRNGNYNV